ncbi:MAG TPA: NrsF family protein [Burkholderiales bacterium]|nr:NrsF family protein [Burkholderiales bacterium]
MITTPDLIESLVADAKPVRRLRPPAARAALWLLFALAIVSLLAVSHGLRPDLGARLGQPLFVTGLAASLLTGALAAVAAFIVSLPDRSRLWLLLPAPALALWVSTIGYGCLTGWVGIRPDSVTLGEAADCFATLVFTSVPLWLAMLLMLRHVALLRSATAAVAASLAVAAIASTALALFHDLDASVMTLMWNLGTAALLVGLGSAFWERMFSWVAPR